MSYIVEHKMLKYSSKLKLCTGPLNFQSKQENKRKLRIANSLGMPWDLKAPVSILPNFGKHLTVGSYIPGEHHNHQAIKQFSFSSGNVTKWNSSSRRDSEQTPSQNGDICFSRVLIQVLKKPQVVCKELDSGWTEE